MIARLGSREPGAGSLEPGVADVASGPLSWRPEFGPRHAPRHPPTTTNHPKLFYFKCHHRERDIAATNHESFLLKLAAWNTVALTLTFFLKLDPILGAGSRRLRFRNIMERGIKLPGLGHTLEALKSIMVHIGPFQKLRRCKYKWIKTFRRLIVKRDFLIDFF